MLRSASLNAAPTSGKSEHGVLYEAENWIEIEAYLFGAKSLHKPESPQVSSPAFQCLQSSSLCAFSLISNPLLLIREPLCKAISAPLAHSAELTSACKAFLFC